MFDVTAGNLEWLLKTLRKEAAGEADVAGIPMPEFSLKELIGYLQGYAEIHRRRMNKRGGTTSALAPKPPASDKPKRERKPPIRKIAVSELSLPALRKRYKDACDKNDETDKADIDAELNRRGFNSEGVREAATNRAFYSRNLKRSVDKLATVSLRSLLNLARKQGDTARAAELVAEMKRRNLHPNAWKAA